MLHTGEEAKVEKTSFHLPGTDNDNITAAEHGFHSIKVTTRLGWESWPKAQLLDHTVLGFSKTWKKMFNFLHV